MMTTETNFSFLRLNQVTKITGISKSTIRRLEKKKEFPPRYYISKKNVAYKSQDIRDWMNSRPLVNGE